MTTTPTFNSWVTCPKPNPQAKVRLFCFPYAGGGASAFRTWSNSLPDTVEVCPVELPGRGRQIKSVLFTQLKPLVSAIASILIPYLDKPFAFYGHSMGGLISFELTRLLRSEYGLTPFHLFISGRRAPQLPSTKPPIYALSEHELLAKLRRFDGTPNAVLEDPELLQLFLPILRADFAVVDTYVYNHEPPLNCPISVFGGLQDQEATHNELQAWLEQTTASFSLQMFNGGHFFINSEQAALLENIAQELQMALASLV